MAHSQFNGRTHFDRPSPVQRRIWSFAAGFLALLMVTACGDSGSDTGGETNAASSNASASGSSAAGRPAADGGEGVVLHRGNGAEPDTIDPHRSSGTWENNIIGDMFIGLYTDAADGSAIPGVIEAGPEGHAISEDGLIHTFRLRDDIVWSDGTPLTSDDFVFAMRRILDPETAARYASILYILKNARDINNGRAPLDTLGVRAIDPQTLEITTAEPAPYLQELLTHYTAFPVPRHVVEEHGDDWIKPQNIAVNGPYKLDEWVPNSFIRLVRNPLFFDNDNVSIDTVYFYPILDASVALRRFRAGEIDVNITTSGFPAQQIEWVRDNLPGEGVIHNQLSTNYVAFNTEKPPFDDKRVRQALSMALDREILAKSIYKSGYVPAYGFVPPGINNYTNAPQYSFKGQSQEERLSAARALLEAAGFGPDTPLRFEMRYRESIDNRRASVAMQAMWKQIADWVDVDITNTEPKVHYNDMESGNFEVGEVGWVADFSDPVNFLFLLDSESGQLNYSNYTNPDYDALLEQAGRTLDLEERAEILEQAEQIILEDAPVSSNAFGATRMLIGDHVKGVVPNAVQIHRTRFITLEQPAEAAQR